MLIKVYRFPSVYKSQQVSPIMAAFKSRQSFLIETTMNRPTAKRWTLSRLKKIADKSNICTDRSHAGFKRMLFKRMLQRHFENFCQVSSFNTQSRRLWFIRRQHGRFPFKLTQMLFSYLCYLPNGDPVQLSKYMGKNIITSLQSLKCNKTGTTRYEAYFYSNVYISVNSWAQSEDINHENLGKKCSNYNCAWENPLGEAQVL